jgi:hypothetical protein
MCWSTTVSLTFAALELSAIVFLILRHDSFDRIGALLGVPLLLQEGLQALLWMEGLQALLRI